MKKLFFLLVGAALLTYSCSQPAPEKEVNPVLSIEGGQIQGVMNADSTVLIYKGIPYAAAPVGDLRWKKPQPVVAWEGVKVADQFGNAAMQSAHDPNDGVYGTEFYAEDPAFSEDCLFLNVWTPENVAGDDKASLPVAMWVHGGAYSAGWGHEITMDGEAWAKKGVILVTINYRLGIFGFLSHPELSAENDGISGNYGLYDQIAALKWVKNNIAQFGGDPENITIFGQSAGGGSIRNLVISPLSRNLMKKAIIQSAGGLGEFIPTQGTNQEGYDAEGKEIMDMGGYKTLEEMRAAPATDLMGLVGKYMAEKHKFLMLAPHTDGQVLTEDFATATYNKDIADIPYMLGYTSNDMMDMSEQQIKFAAVRDSLSNQPTYCYLFNRPLPTDGRKSLEGAFHSSELWYVFNTLDRSWRPFTEADHQLSEEMVTAWTNFCKFGNPNGEKEGAWKPSTKEAPFTFEFKIKE